MRGFTGKHPDWLTVVQLPAYAPELNPVEGAWANIKASLGNLRPCSTPGQLAVIMKNRLKRIQYRPGLIDGFLAQTGLSTEPNPRRPRPWPSRRLQGQLSPPADLPVDPLPDQVGLPGVPGIFADHVDESPAQ
jgi:hypothetical protein